MTVSGFTAELCLNREVSRYVSAIADKVSLSELVVPQMTAALCDRLCTWCIEHRIEGYCPLCLACADAGF